MSFMFTVIRDESGIRLVEPVPDTLKHIPVGKFVVSGHSDTTAGRMQVLSVSMSDSHDHFIASATSNYCNK